MSLRTDYQHTIRSCYVGYITQAVVNNFAPLLFLTFRSRLGISLDRIALLTSLNFAIQLATDAAAAKFVDRIGYRAALAGAHVLSLLGLLGLAILPNVLARPFAGLVASVAVYAVGGGMIEVLVSPVVEACPTEGKAAAMSLLHSFYCWGHMGVVLLSTLFFAIFGVGRWCRWLACCCSRRCPSPRWCPRGSRCPWAACCAAGPSGC